MVESTRTILDTRDRIEEENVPLVDDSLIMVELPASTMRIVKLGPCVSYGQDNLHAREMFQRP